MKHALLAAPFLALAFAISSSAPASADALDDAFINTLHTLGFSGLGPVDIDNAHVICDQVWSGMSPYEATAQLDDAAPNFDYTDAKLFVATSIATYCPPSEPAQPLVLR